MNKMFRGLVAWLVLASMPMSCFAWGSGGHRIAAIMAWRSMKCETQEKLAKLLRQHPRSAQEFAIPAEVTALGEAAENEWLFAQATIWPDLIRGNRQFDRPTWHYIDLPLYLTEGDRAVMHGQLTVNMSPTLPEVIDNAELNAVQAIKLAAQNLRSQRSAADKAIDICWLNHLTTDLAQPNHTTALYSRLTFPDPAGDKGGNAIPVQPEKNLHAYWDGLLGWEISFDEARERASALLAEMKPHQAADAAELDPMQWVEQGHELAKAKVYSPQILQAAYEKEVGNTRRIETIVLSDEYQAESKKLAERQIARGAFRLAAMMDQLLADPPADCPTIETETTVTSSR